MRDASLNPSFSVSRLAVHLTSGAPARFTWCRCW